MEEPSTQSKSDKQKQFCKEGLRLLRAWNISDAGALFAEAAREFPSWAFPQDGQALTSVLMGDLDRAIGHIIKGFDLDNRETIWGKIGRIDLLTVMPLSRRDRERVITLAKRIQPIVIKKMDRLALHIVGVAFLVGGEYRLADADFRAAISFGRGSCDDFLGISIVHALMGHQLDAWAAAVRGARDIRPETLLIPANYLLSTAHTRFLGDVQERFEEAVGTIDVPPRLHAVFCILRFYGGLYESVVESCSIAKEHFHKTNEPELAHLIGLYGSASMAFMAAKRGDVDKAVNILTKVYLTGNPHNVANDDLIHLFVERCLLEIIDNVLLDTISKMREGKHERQSVNMKYCAEGLAFLLRGRKTQSEKTNKRVEISAPIFYRMVLIGTIGNAHSYGIANTRVKSLVSATLHKRREVGLFAPMLKKMELLAAFSAVGVGEDEDDLYLSRKMLKANTSARNILTEVSAPLIKADELQSEGYLMSIFARALTPEFDAYAGGDFYTNLFPEVGSLMTLIMKIRLRNEMIRDFWSNADDVSAIMDSFLLETRTNEEKR